MQSQSDRFSSKVVAQGHRVRWLVAVLIAQFFLSGLPCAGEAKAEAYPARRITLIVPFAAGGSTDAVARIMAARMGQSLGQPVIVENVTGGTGNMGVARLVRSPPDGYTIVIGNLATHVANASLYDLKYDVEKDMEPIILLPNNPYLILSNVDVPAHTLTELISWMKANPSKVTMGMPGIGSADHLAGLQFERLTGTKIEYIPYRGSAPALLDLEAGHTTMIIDQSSSAVPQLHSDRLRAYAVTASARLAAAPEVPTTAEANLPNFEISTWNGLWAPRHTPPDVIALLNKAGRQALSDPDTQQKLAKLGQNLPPVEMQTPEALAKYQAGELAKWSPMLKPLKQDMK